MTKTNIPTARDRMIARRAIRSAWSERERQRRRKMAVRKQQAFLTLLVSSAPPTAARVA